MAYKQLSKQQKVRGRARALKLIKELKKLVGGAKIALHYSNNWELAVAVILSAQTTDKKVNQVTERLFKKYPKLDDYVKADLKEFQKDIREIGFYRNKAKSILASAKLIKEKFGGKVPNTMSGILTLPGVARKSANVILGNAYGVVEGIAVDTHVRRLSQYYGLTENDDPVKIEKDLMQILPKRYWFDFTYLLIDYGRKYCSAHKMKKNLCPIG